MSHKHIINDHRKLAVDGLVGLGRLNPALNIDQVNRVACLRQVPKDRVAIVSALSSCLLPCSSRKQPLTVHGKHCRRRFREEEAAMNLHVSSGILSSGPALSKLQHAISLD